MLTVLQPQAAGLRSLRGQDPGGPGASGGEGSHVSVLFVPRPLCSFSQAQLVRCTPGHILFPGNKLHFSNLDWQLLAIWFSDLTREYNDTEYTHISALRSASFQMVTTSLETASEPLLREVPGRDIAGKTHNRFPTVTKSSAASDPQNICKLLI